MAAYTHVKTNAPMRERADRDIRFEIRLSRSSRPPPVLRRGASRQPRRITVVARTTYAKRETEKDRARGKKEAEERWMRAAVHDMYAASARHRLAARERDETRQAPGSGRRTTSGRGSRRDLSGAQPGQAFLTPFALIYPRIYPRIDILSFKYFSAGE